MGGGVTCPGSQSRQVAEAVRVWALTWVLCSAPCHPWESLVVCLGPCRREPKAVALNAGHSQECEEDMEKQKQTNKLETKRNALSLLRIHSPEQPAFWSCTFSQPMPSAWKFCFPECSSIFFLLTEKNLCLHPPIKKEQPLQHTN